MNKEWTQKPKEFVEFYKKVETWQNEMLFRLKKAGVPEKKDTVRLLSQAGLSIMLTNQLDLDPELYKGAVWEFARLVAAERQEMKDMIEKMTELTEDMDFLELARRVFRDDERFFRDLADRNGLSYELMIFILDHALRPFLRYMALPYQEALQNAGRVVWDLGFCPVCGFKANYSRVRAEDGRRFLFCEHCFTEWEFKYLGCIYCGNSEPDTIRYFIVEGDDAHQVFVCDKCKGYIKTFDERKGKIKTDLFIAGIETAYLDLIAEEEGYSNTFLRGRNLN